MSDLLQPKMGQIFKYIGKCYIPEQVYRLTNTQIYSLNSTPQIKIRFILAEAIILSIKNLCSGNAMQFSGVEKRCNGES